MGENRGWAWVEEDGTEHIVSEDQLTFALSSEQVPAYTLVCREDWAEWLPAMQVAELRWALPAGQADTPRKPGLLTGGVRDNPPLGAYKTLQFRANEIAAGRISPQFETALALSPAQPRVTRPPQGLTPYTDNDLEEATVQLELDDLPDAEGQVDALTSAQAHQYAVRDARPPTDAPPLPPQAQPATRPSSRSTLPPRSLRGLEPRAHAPRPQAAPPQAPRRQTSLAIRPHGRLRWLVLLGVPLVAGLVGLAVYLTRAPQEPAPTPVVVTPPSPTAEPKTDVVSGCAIHQGPSRLGEFAKADLRPGVAELDSGMLAVGYGQTSRYAMGLLVDPKNLSAERVFSDYQNSPLLSVTPRVTHTETQFLLERAASTLQNARTIPATPPFTLGVYQGTLSVRADRGQNAETVWNSPWETFSVPEVVRVTAKHHAAALRGGGERGAILVGLLQENGKALGALAKVEVKAERVGEPSLTVSPPGSTTPQLMVAFSGGAQSVDETLYVARSTPPQLPTSGQALRVPGPVHAPSIGALSDGSFLVQWSDEQSVFVALFNPDMVQVGPRIQVSGAGVDAREGALFVGTNAILSLYMVRNGQNHEMWSAVLLCK